MLPIAVTTMPAGITYLAPSRSSDAPATIANVE
jgi:hypothetical protein